MKISLSNNTAVVFRLSAMGDVALLTGVLLYWHTLYNIKFIVITKEEWASLFQNHPAVINTEALTKENLSHKSYIDICKKLATKYQDFPLLDLHASTRSRILSHHWKQSVYRYNKMPILRRFFLWSKGRFGKKKLLEKNVCQRYADLLCANYVNKNQLKPQIFLDPQEILYAQQTLLELFPEQNKKILVIHPFATHSAKTFNIERWQELGAILQQKYHILWVGKGTLPETIQGKSLVNKTNLRELCAILSQSHLLLTGDSGPMHLANAVDIPLLALFGPTSQEWGFFPVGNNAYILQKNVSCRPCSLHGKQKCTQKESCLQKISNEEILAKIENILAR